MSGDMTIEYLITLCSPLVDVERSRLGEVHKLCNIAHFEFMPLSENMINVVLGEDDMSPFSTIAGWLSNIGAEDDVFCIKEIRTYHTSIVSHEVKELLRT